MANHGGSQNGGKTCPVSTGIGVLMSCVSLAVLYGWLIESRSIVQISAGLAPMQATTAIGFLLFALGLFFLSAGPRWSRRGMDLYLSIALLVWGILNVTQHFTGVSLGIDYILGEPFIADKSPAPGRMSLLTSISFTMAGVAMTLAALISKSPRREVVVVLIASLLNGLSGAALFCYLLDIPRNIWLGARFSEMAILTATGFFLLSMGLVMQRFRCGRALYHEAFRWMWAPTFCATLFAVIIIYMGYHVKAERNRMELANIRAEFLADLLDTYDSQLRLALSRMAERVAALEPYQRSQWESDARHYLEDFSSLEYLRVIDPTMGYDWSYTAELASAYNPALDAQMQAFQNSGDIIVTPAQDDNEAQLTYWVYEGEDMARDRAKVLLMAVVDLDGFIHDAIKLIEPGMEELVHDYIIPQYRLGGKPDVHQTGEAFVEFSPELYLPVKVELEYVKSSRLLEVLFLVGGTVLAIILASLVHLIYLNRQRYQELDSAQQTLKRRKTRLEAYVDHAPAAVAMFDLRMRYIACSERWLKDYGIQGQQVIGHCHYDIFPNISDEWKTIHRRCLEGATEFNERDHWRPEGWEHDQYLRWEIRPWYETNESVGGIMMFTEDITEAVMREEELITTREKAESANRAKTNFLANMSHEIRTPMNSILGFAELLSKEIDNPRQKQFLNSIQSSGKTLLALINDLLDLAKIEAGKVELAPKPVNLRQTFAELMSVFQLQAEMKDIRLSYAVSGNLPEYLLLDDFRLRQVLLNLLSNAVKFTASGSVTLRLNVVRNNDAFDLEFAVEDTGFGIPDSFRERAFGNFEQAGDSAQGGTGLGLAISSKLVGLAGGVLDYRSQLEKGTTFFFTLPGVYRAAPAIETRPINGDEQRLLFPLCTILIVDDVAENLKLMRAVFEEHENVYILEASNGAEAIEMTEQHQPDLILLDISMPDLDGRVVCQRLRHKHNLNTPIIAVTASVQESTSQLMELGFNECLFKPTPPHVLLRTCHRWLNGATQLRKPAPSAQASNAAAIPDSVLPEPVIAQLKADLEEHRNGLALNELEKLAKRFEAAAQENQAHGLAEIAQRLKQAAQTFDIASARQALGQLSQYLNQKPPSST